MDRLQITRPENQTQRQTTKTTFGNSAPVPKVISRHAPARPVMDIMHRPVAPSRPRPATLHAGIPPALAPAPKVLAAKPIGRPGQLAVQLAAANPAVSAARRSPLDMDLPGDESPLRQIKQVQWRKARRFASRGMAVAIVLVITLGGLIFSQSYLKLHKVFKGSTGTAAALQEDVKPELLKGEGRGRVNVLLLGRGGGDHDAPDLTDTIMIASIDPVNKTASLLSLPRDFWVNVPGQGVMKLNAAWQSGEFKALGRRTTGSTDPKAIQAGYQMVDSTIKEMLDIEIDYHVLVDFQAFKQAVDTVGGVEVNVPEDLFDPTMAWENHGNPVLAKAGLQTFDGTRALIYVRSRETSSDFARGERQRMTMVALKSKVAKLGTLSNPLKLSGLLSAFGNNVQTDLSLKNASRLYQIIKGVQDSNVTSIGLTDGTNQLITTGNINGQSVVLPKAGLYQYTAIQEYVRAKLQDPYIKKENAKVLVLNGSTLEGRAATKAEELKTYGYNVIGTGNTPTSGWNQTVVVDLTHRNKYTKNYLEKRFGQKAANKLEDTSIPTNGADFVIILGSDEANYSQTPAH